MTHSGSGTPLSLDELELSPSPVLPPAQASRQSSPHELLAARQVAQASFEHAARQSAEGRP